MHILCILPTLPAIHPTIRISFSNQRFKLQFQPAFQTSEVVKVLLDAKANINAQVENGTTTLRKVVKYCWVQKSIWKGVKNGIQVTLKDQLVMTKPKLIERAALMEWKDVRWKMHPAW